MTKVWHPLIKDLSIEIDEDKVAAHVAAGWLKNKSTRKTKARSRKSDVSETANEPAKAEEPAKASEPEKADTTSTGDGEAN